MKTLLFVVLGLIMVGCSVGPNYQRPEIEQPREWQYQDTTLVLDSTAIAAADTGWWEMFGDTVLTNLMHTALRENHDLRIAAARVDQFLGLYGVAKSDFFPKLDAQGMARRGQSLISGDGSAERPTANLFALELSASWEIDIWGKVRRATEAARADLLAAEESRRAVALSVVGFVAEAYIDLLSLDKQLAVARRTVESREMSLDLFRQRLAKGDISELELSQIESQYWLAKAQVPVLEKTIAQLEHALSVLLARNPGRISRGLPLDSLTMPGIPSGIPSDILEQRPDVRQAEEQLRAANARIGVAKSLYFPSISLTGLFGVASGDLSNLFTANAQTWAVGGGILAPIFRWGEISGQVEAAEAVQRQTLHAYVQAVQSAFRDAEDALVARSRTQEQQEAQANQVQSLRVYERLARMRYRDGVTSYLEVLDAERSLFTTELEFAQTQGNLFKSVVGVYKAFAGGWADWVAMEAYQPDDPVDQRSSDPQAKQQEPKAP